MRTNLVKRFSNLVPASLYVRLRQPIERNYNMENGMIRKALTGIQGLVLDMGCGSGEIQPHISGIRIIGVEKNAKLLGYARKKDYTSLVCGDITTLPFHNNIFEGVVLCKLGHHLDSMQMSAALKEAWRVLKPKGRLVFLDPLPPSRTTTLLHNLIARIEIGAHHRTPDESMPYFHDFGLVSMERFRKLSFDFYMLTFVPRDK